MVDRSSDLIYVYLMISIIQEETLSVKGDFENSLPHLEFKLKYIMQTMEYFWTTFQISNWGCQLDYNILWGCIL